MNIESKVAVPILSDVSDVIEFSARKIDDIKVRENSPNCGQNCNHCSNCSNCNSCSNCNGGNCRR